MKLCGNSILSGVYLSSYIGSFSFKFKQMGKPIEHNITDVLFFQIEG